MRIEVEQKFRVEDLGSVRGRLSSLEAKRKGEREEADTYYAHPSRNFAETDEALRIRRVGGKGLVAYKGPKLDATTKTRHEIELPAGEDEATTAQWGSLWEALGFRPVAEVRKRREKFEVQWQGREVEASLDEVAEVGTYVELELVTAQEDMEAAKGVIASLAEELALRQSERRSYLELLLETRSGVHR